MKKHGLLLSLGFSALFVACGDDSSSVTGNETMDSGNKDLSSSSAKDAESSEKNSSSSANGPESSTHSSSSKEASHVRTPVTKAGFVTWYGDESIYRVETGRDAGKNTSGTWYSYTDNNSGGATRIIWPVSIGEDQDELSSVIEHCGGVCGSYVMDQGTLDFNPFFGLGIDVAGVDEKGNQKAVDVTEMKGVCISYASSAPLSIKLSLGDSVDKEIEYSNYNVTLPEAPKGTVQEITWSQFSQAPWGTEMSIESTIENLVAFKFEISDAHASEGFFNIMSFGAYEGECLIPNTSIIQGVDSGTADIPEPDNSMDSISALVKKTLLAEKGLTGNYPQYPGISVYQSPDKEIGWNGFLIWPYLETGFGDQPHSWYAFSNDDSMMEINQPDEVTCNGLCITINARPSVYYGFGADLVEELQAKGADLSKYKQLNIAYSSTNLPMDIVLIPEQNESLVGDDAYNINQGDNFRVTLPATDGDIKEVTLKFSDFAQKGWGVKQNISDVVKKLGAIQFAVNGYTIDFGEETELSTDITIYGLGWE